LISKVAISQALDGALMFLALDENTIVSYLAMSKDLIFKLKLPKDTVVEALQVIDNATVLNLESA
jgi:hypothetical protein